MRRRSNRIVRPKHLPDWQDGSRKDFPGCRSCCWQTVCMHQNRLWICAGNIRWEFLIRYKKGSIPSIAEEYEKIPEKGKTEKAEFVNDIDYEGKPVTRIKISGRKGWRNNRIPMAEQHKDYQRGMRKRWRKQEENAGR